MLRPAHMHRVLYPNQAAGVYHGVRQVPPYPDLHLLSSN